MKNSLFFIIKSTLLGIVVSVILLALIPQLRNGNQLQVRNIFPGDMPQKVSFAEAINRSAPAVVNIYSQQTIRRSAMFRNNEVERTSLGSGVIMSENGYILTCLHVIAGADTIEVIVAEQTKVYEAQVIGFDPLTDLAVLKINANNLPVIPQLEEGEENKTQVGDLVLAIGNPYNLGQTITQGIISATGRSEVSQLGIATHRNFIQMDATLNQGNSGGALVDSNGYLVGINNANYKIIEGGQPKDVPGVFFAVPYQMAQKVMRDIISKGRVIRGYAGLQGVDHELAGVIITAVENRSPAFRAGIQVSDVLMSVGGTAINSAVEVQSIVSNTLPGTTLDFEIKRRGETIVVPVVVGDFDTVLRNG